MNFLLQLIFTHNICSVSGRLLPEKRTYGQIVLRLARELQLKDLEAPYELRVNIVNMSLRPMQEDPNEGGTTKKNQCC